MDEVDVGAVVDHPDVETFTGLVLGGVAPTDDMEDTGVEQGQQQWIVGVALVDEEAPGALFSDDLVDEPLEELQSLRAASERPATLISSRWT